MSDFNSARTLSHSSNTFTGSGFARHSSQSDAISAEPHGLGTFSSNAGFVTARHTHMLSAVLSEGGVDVAGGSAAAMPPGSGSESSNESDEVRCFKVLCIFALVPERSEEAGAAPFAFVLDMYSLCWHFQLDDNAVMGGSHCSIARPRSSCLPGATRTYATCMSCMTSKHRCFAG